MSERIAAWAGPLAGLALFAFAAVILHRELAEVDYRDVLVHFHAVPASRVALAFGLTVAGYLALTGYDTLALRSLGRKLAYPRIALASFVAYVLSHNVGFAFLSGSAVRYRMFTSGRVSAKGRCQLAGRASGAKVRTAPPSVRKPSQNVRMLKVIARASSAAGTPQLVNMR